jgi:hypothetical protein
MKALPTSEMKMAEINLERQISEIVQDVEQESDLMVLSQTLAQEKSKGNRSLLVQKIIARAESLRSHGDGASESEPLFELQEGTKPQDLADHDFGLGSDSRQDIPREQRMLQDMYRNEAEKRSNNIDVLSDVIETMANGTLVFQWGHVIRPQKEIIADGKTVVTARPSQVVLKHCPKCGKTNRVDTSIFAECYHCGFKLMPILKKMVEKFPAKFKDMVFKF